MNIFFLDYDPEKAARYHCDKHVNKMIIEHLQMMSVALDHHGFEPARKKDGTYYSVRAYRNHPCTLWVKESLANFMWLWKLTRYLCIEFYERYGKRHAGLDSLLSIDLLDLINPSSAFHYPDIGHTPPAQAMPDFCKVPGKPTEAYRNYYNYIKWEFAVWNKSTPAPSWWAPCCPLSAKNEY